MLDGLLGRGFAAKCKSLIKLTKSRIDMIRRKRKATEKFLKKDIADLLVNGLDINAYGRAEGLVVELTLSSCYDFVEQSCDFVLKHLPVMQKVSGCPEECREAVSSLMFAAARFSDLPELRDLRQIFQDRYGNSLECYVKQEFATYLDSRSSTLEKKVNLMQEIALEYSIRWDSKAFEQRMSKPSAFAQDQRISTSNRLTDYNKPSHAKDARGVKYDVLLEKSPEIPGHRFHNGKETVVSKRNDHDLQSRSKLPVNGFNPLNGSDEPISQRGSHGGPLRERQEVAAKKNDRGYLKEGSMLKPIGSGGSSRDRKVEQFEGGFEPHDIWGNILPQREIRDIAAAGKPDFTPSHAGFRLKSNPNEPIAVNLGGLPHTDDTDRKASKDETPRVRSHHKNAIPPPYVKSNSKMKNSTCEADVVPSHIVGDGIPKHSDVANASERIQIGLDNSDQERQASRHARRSRQSSEKELSSHQDAAEIPVLKHKSMRRKHSKSRSSHNDDSAEDAEVVARKSRSRRRDESRRGLQILFDDERHQNDEEERIMDKLLIHYSKKPSIPVPEKAKGKSKSGDEHRMDISAGEYFRNGNKEGSYATPEMVTVPSRSVSLPREQSGTVEVKKVYTRAASFQPDRSDAARHVHPKLPDYDDLAARFAALRGR